MKLLLIVTIASITLAGCSMKTSSATPEQTIEVAQQNTDKQLEQDYKNAVKSVISQYQETGATLELQKQLIVVKTPATYLESHLQLVLLFDRAVQAQGTAEQEATIRDLNDLISQISWL